MGTQVWDRLRVLKPPPELLWSLAAIAAAALLVEYTRTGIDLLALLAMGAFFVVLDAMCGDWMSDHLGPNKWSAVLGILAAMGVWSLIGRTTTADRFFRAAEQAGYQTLYYDSSAGTAPKPEERVIRTGESLRSMQPPPSQLSSRTPAIPESAVEDQRRPAQGPAAASGQSAGTSGIRLPWGHSTKPSALKLDALQVGSTGSALLVRARLTSEGQPLSGASITFSANGRSIGDGVTAADGYASARFTTRVPGQYQIAARFAGSPDVRGSSAATLLNILPGKF